MAYHILEICLLIPAMWLYMEARKQIILLKRIKYLKSE